MERIGQGQLAEFKELVLANPKMYDLMVERDKAMRDLESNAPKPYTHHEPHYTPKGDLHFPKRHMTKGLGAKEFAKQYHQIQRDFKDNSYQVTKEYCADNGLDYEAQLLDNLGQHNFNTLIGYDGVNRVYEMEREREDKQPAEELDVNEVDLKMNDALADQIFNGIDRAEGLGNVGYKDLTHDHDLDLNLHMDIETTDNIFNDRQIHLEEFMDNSKDMTVSKQSLQESELEK